MSNLTFKDYEMKMRPLAFYPNCNENSIPALTYCALKLNGEAGEVAEKLGKIIRDKNGCLSQDDKHLMMLELGDILWYVMSTAHELGENLEAVAQMNILKLQSRLSRGVLGGSGNTR